MKESEIVARLYEGNVKAGTPEIEFINFEPRGVK